MKLHSIDKSRYRKHLNRLLAACACALLTGSLAISSMLIAFVGTEQGGNFTLNLAGVGLSVAIIVGLLHRYKSHPAMKEIYYVWRLKQELNLINRKLSQLDLGAGNNDKNAMIVLNFSYQASDQLWRLDDNTITLDVLNRKIEQLAQQLQRNDYIITIDDYNSALVAGF